MLERVRENCGQMPDILSADNGYLSEDNVRYCADANVDAYLSLRKKDARGRDFPPATDAERMRFTMQVKLGTREGHKIYARRKVIVEPVFGQIKAAMGFQRFSLRGLFKAASEWGIVCCCHNLLKLFRARPMATT